MIPMGLQTPLKVRSLQRALYRQAKAHPQWRAWSLYGELCRREVLEKALKEVISNAGAPGEDRVTTEVIEAEASTFLDGLQKELKERSYRPRPVLRVWVPKDNGKERPIGIGTVKDRVVQTALVLLLQPIFEPDFHDLSFGYRPKRSAQQAVDAVKRALLQGKTAVIDADLSAYFDTIPRTRLMKLVTKRVSDGAILRLIKLFLSAPIVEECEGKRRITASRSGVPQGGPLSPLMSNLYLNRLDHEVNNRRNLGATLVRFADDMVVLCFPDRGQEHYVRLREYLQRQGLKLNTTKTRIVDANQESFRFVGFEIRMRISRKSGRSYTHVQASRKAQQKLREAVRAELNHWTRWRSCAETVKKVNYIVRGWSNYFHYGNCSELFCYLRNWVVQRLRKWLWRKHDRKFGRYTYFTDQRIYGEHQLWKMPVTAGWTR
jgi:group II intron reverse transcriptase/maturase